MDRHCTCHVLATATTRWIDVVLLDSLGVAAVCPLLALMLLAMVSLSRQVLVCRVIDRVRIPTLHILLLRRVTLSIEVTFIPLSVSWVLIVAIGVLPGTSAIVVRA